MCRPNRPTLHESGVVERCEIHQERASRGDWASAKEQKTYPNLFAPLELSSLFQVPSFFPTYFDDISSDHPIIWQGYIKGDTRTTLNSADVRRDPTYVELFVRLAGRLK